MLDAAWDYAAATGRRVSIEYALIRDVNDQPWRADLLGELLAGPAGARQPDPAQPDPRLAVDASEPGVDAGVRAAWTPAGVPVTVRDTRGREIDGACGQLAARAICLTMAAGALARPAGAGPVRDQ